MEQRVEVGDGEGGERGETGRRARHISAFLLHLAYLVAAIFLFIYHFLCRTWIKTLVIEGLDGFGCLGLGFIVRKERPNKFG